MNIETEFELSQEDYKEIVKYHLRRRSARLIANIILFISGTVVGAGAILMAFSGETTSAIFYAFVCLVFVGTPILAPRLSVRSLQRTPFYQGKVRIQVNDFGTRFEVCNGRFQHPMVRLYSISGNKEPVYALCLEGDVPAHSQAGPLARTGFRAS